MYLTDKMGDLWARMLNSCNWPGEMRSGRIEIRASPTTRCAVMRCGNMNIDTAYFAPEPTDATFVGGWERGSWILLLREEAMRIQKLESRAGKDQRDLTARQQAVLSAAVTDERQNAWALEMLGRRNAVARWRGQPGCSVRDVMRALDALPA